MIKYAAAVLVMLLIFLNTGCSSAPEKQYRVTRYLDLANTWTARGDRKRQEQKLDIALSNYNTAYKYAHLRNDLELMGILQLKKAMLYILLDKPDNASQFIEHARQLQVFEGAELSLSIKALEAKQAFEQGETQRASAYADELSAAYEGNIEKQIYYRWLSWMYTKNSLLPWEQMNQDLTQLELLKSKGDLNNIEVLSFVVYHNALWRVDHQAPETKQAIEQAIVHFSELELTNRVRDCYGLAARFYRQRGEIEKAHYFSKRQQRLSDSINISNSSE
ncbi:MULTISPECIES: hypothetical protein [Pseudoalteromonas]|uniref:Lipoprotein n=1 Tax=Pseudoalteromonas luteoviolacea (strain 2ta16) TaxID=1353533 RepID=V4HTQ6_PSEL2|nr:MULTISPECIES: hypothetical protein [Pseudoalteromonas]ESP93178.1 hypothetical protein PL2TA16_03399 [Pseudoalteromonas luteoviolacea 2ta16]KZN37050.1 hypothetical protein N483_21635 [Pseudoalteromonas luteoviolacea NCIMB 1944]MCG7549979.1 hypothetical protein [Pseudoalteromonas sp. Of7M-16]